ncbi:MAG: hypothetical protein JXB05_34965 [Myxococcaceae bacterium]|nr:hypothetical protein [Myxococcaceae bacterium]
MATIQITIGPTASSPPTAQARHGDTVEFILGDRPDSVTVTFTDGTPLALEVSGALTYPNSVTLSPSLTTEDYGVAPGSLKRKYSFTFPQYVAPEETRHKFPEGEQTTASGELEVTDDPEM